MITASSSSSPMTPSAAARSQHGFVALEARVPLADPGRRARAGVRPAERLRARPGLERGARLPERMGEVRREAVGGVAAQQVELAEAGHLLEVAVALAPHLLEIGLAPGVDAEAVHRHVHRGPP